MMRKEKQIIETLRGRIDFLEDQVAEMRREIMFKDDHISKLQVSLNEAREEFKEKYSKLLERYIAMMERTAGIDEQREAD